MGRRGFPREVGHRPAVHEKSLPIDLRVKGDRLPKKQPSTRLGGAGIPPVVASGHEFEDLQRRVQENLVSFLETELDLAINMFEVLENTRDEDHRNRLLKNIELALTAVQRFKGKIRDATARNELSNAAKALERTRADVCK